MANTVLPNLLVCLSLLFEVSYQLLHFLGHKFDGFPKLSVRCTTRLLLRGIPVVAAMPSIFIIAAERAVATWKPERYEKYEGLGFGGALVMVQVNR